MTHDDPTGKSVDSKPERTVTWPVKDGDVLVGSVRLSKGVHECVLPDGSVVETFKSLKFALEFLHQRGRPISPEEQAARLIADVDELSRKSLTDRSFWLADFAKRNGIDEARLQELVKAEIEAREKRAREQQEADRRREEREEKQARESRAKVKDERAEIEREDRRARRDRSEARTLERQAQQRQREIDRQLAIILKQPTIEHDARLTEVATRLGEDLNALRTRFAELLDVERECASVGDDTPWPEAVDANTLLNKVHKHRERYVIIHDEHAAVTTTLWTAFSWCHDIATHSPFLLITSHDAGGNAAKTLLCSLLRYMTRRGRIVTDPSGASFFHMIDRLHPCLIIDNAENLFKRKKDLVDLLDASWTRGIPVTRHWHGVDRFYDVFCPKVIGAIANLNFLPPNAMARSIHFDMWPKLPHESLERDFNYQDDDEFLTLRRKLARFTIDNAEALRTALPAIPEGFDNRLRQNWKLIFAIADLAGGSWPKCARAAAVKLTQEYDAPSEGKQCLQMFVELFLRSEYKGMVISAWAREQFIADPTSDWANYRGRGPITQWGIGHILANYRIKPGVIHPRGHPADRGYKLEWFEKPFRHYLNIEVADILKKWRKRKK
jgi:Protein of unknown function (DUF3631)